MSVNELVYTRYLTAFAQVCAGDTDLVGAATEEQAVAIALGARDACYCKSGIVDPCTPVGPQSKADVEKHVVAAVGAAKE